MVFCYRDIDIRTLCEKEEVAVEKLGTTIALKLQDRLADLEALEKVSEIFSGNPQTYGPNGTHYKVDVDINHRIVFCCGHSEVPLEIDGEVDWSNVSRIQIIKVESNDEFKQF